MLEIDWDVLLSIPGTPSPSCDTSHKNIIKAPASGIRRFPSSIYMDPWKIHGSCFYDFICLGILAYCITYLKICLMQGLAKYVLLHFPGTCSFDVLCFLKVPCPEYLRILWIKSASKWSKQMRIRRLAANRKSWQRGTKCNKGNILTIIKVSNLCFIIIMWELNMLARQSVKIHVSAFQEVQVKVVGWAEFIVAAFDWPCPAILT